MKKVLTFAAAIMLFAGMASAQLGIHVGYAPQTYTSTYTSGSNTTTTTTDMTGLFAGIDYNVNITGDLNVSVGLQGRYNMSSDTVSAGLGTLVGGSVENKYTQMLIDVPVLFNYGLNLSDALKISVFAGPTVNFALSGNTHTTTTATVLGSTSTTESDSDWYGDNSNRKKLDIAFTVGAAVTFSDIKIFGGYNMGLLNLTTADNTTLKGSNLFIGVGYNL